MDKLRTICIWVAWSSGGAIGKYGQRRRESKYRLTRACSGARELVFAVIRVLCARPLTPTLGATGGGNTNLQ
jgi:hypothetical protein